MEQIEKLKLESQVCFPLYSVSRLLTRAYKPYLDKLGITYPQYLVLLVLWENNCVTVNQISETLLLNTNTVSPLLKRMEKLKLIKRTRSNKDERIVHIELTQNGEKLKEKAKSIPDSLLNVLLTENVKLPDIIHLKGMLDEWIDVLTQRNGESTEIHSN